MAVVLRLRFFNQGYQFFNLLGTGLKLRLCFKNTSVSKKVAWSIHRRPKLTMRVLFYFFSLSCDRDICGRHTLLYNDSSPVTYGGVVLQLFEVIKICIGTQQFALKVKYSDTFWMKSSYPVAVLCSLMFASSSGRCYVIWAILYRSVGSPQGVRRLHSTRYRVRSACGADKRQSIRTVNRPYA